MSDLIDRQAAIDAINVKNVNKGIISALQSIIEELPSAQLERDIPIKPIETTDKAWGIPSRQADYLLRNLWTGD